MMPKNKYKTVDWVVYWTVDWTVRRAVDWDRATDRAAFDAVNWALRNPVAEAVIDAAGDAEEEDFRHPVLGDFLREVGVVR